MKQFVYPAVFYYEKETDSYAVAFHDLGLFTEGDTVEQAFLSAKKFLNAYFDCAVKIEAEYDQPSTYISTKEKYSTEIVMLVDTEIGTVVANLKRVPVEELFSDSVDINDYKLRDIE